MCERHPPSKPVTLRSVFFSLFSLNLYHFPFFDGDTFPLTPGLSLHGIPFLSARRGNGRVEDFTPRGLRHSPTFPFFSPPPFEGGMPSPQVKKTFFFPPPRTTSAPLLLFSHGFHQVLADGEYPPFPALNILQPPLIDPLFFKVGGPTEHDPLSTSLAEAFPPCFWTGHPSC